MLDLGEHEEAVGIYKVGIYKDVPTVLECGQQSERLLKAVADAVGWLPRSRSHVSELSSTTPRRDPGKPIPPTHGLRRRAA